MSILPESQCADIGSNAGLDLKQNICAKSPLNNGLCDGDNGGPLMIKYNEEILTVGIYVNSLGKQENNVCNVERRDSPQIHLVLRLSFYKDWALDIMIKNRFKCL